MNGEVGQLAERARFELSQSGGYLFVVSFISLTLDVSMNDTNRSFP